MAIKSHPSLLHADLLALLLIGEPSIDKEHGELIAQLDDLASHSEAPPGYDGFSKILGQLGVQINAHFSNEENFMRSLDMPENEIASHIQAHTNILEQYTQLNFDVMQGKKISCTEILHIIKDWLIVHIVSFDLNIKNYLPKATGAASKETDPISS